MKTNLLFLSILFLTVGVNAQVQPTVHNASFTKIPKSSGSDCACAGWINKDIADQGESSTSDGDDVLKLDNLESDGIYQEVAVVANSDYELSLMYEFDTDPTTTDGLEVYVLKGSEYVAGYTPAYALPADAAQDGFGYETVASVETATNQLASTTITPPGNTDYNTMTTLEFNTGSETSIAIFVRAVGTYDAANHGDSSKDKGWMNGDSEVRLNDLTLVNATLAVDDIQASASQIAIYPNPVKDIVKFESQSPISSVEIYDTNGRVVMNSAVMNNTLNVSQLSKGTYVVNISTEDKQVQTQKLIKQ